MTTTTRPSVDDRDDTQTRVREAALDLFARQGFAATGIRQIAEAVGVTSAALYHYMGTKEELLAGLAREANARMLRIARSALAGAESPESRLVTLVRAHVVAHVMNQREALVIDNELRSLSRKHRRAVVAIRDAYEELWRQTLHDGAETGVFTMIDQRTTRLALLEMCTGVAHWFDPMGGLTPTALAGQFADLALACVRARRGSRSLALAQIASPTDAVILQVVLDAASAVPTDGER